MVGAFLFIICSICTIFCISDEAKYIRSFLYFYNCISLYFYHLSHLFICRAGWLAHILLEGSSRYSWLCLSLSSHAVCISRSMLAAERLLFTSLSSLNIWCASIIRLRDVLTLTTTKSQYANLSPAAVAGSIDVQLYTYVLHSSSITKLQRGPKSRALVTASA
jgi:hypothetical protein